MEIKFQSNLVLLMCPIFVLISFLFPMFYLRISDIDTVSEYQIWIGGLYYFQRHYSFTKEIDKGYSFFPLEILSIIIIIFIYLGISEQIKTIIGIKKNKLERNTVRNRIIIWNVILINVIIIYYFLLYYVLTATFFYVDKNSKVIYYPNIGFFMYMIACTINMMTALVYSKE